MFGLLKSTSQLKRVKAKKKLLKIISCHDIYVIWADPSKEVVALGQTYFAIQTRKQEITEQEYDTLSDDEKDFIKED